MLDKKKIENDGRFYINSEELNFLFSRLVINSYSFDSIKIGQLRRLENGKICTLYETINYKFIKNIEERSLAIAYDEYCCNKINLQDNSKRSQCIFLQLKESIETEDYNPRKGVIIVNQYNIIEDGLHRSCILLSKYGPDYDILVLKLNRKVSRKLMLLSPIFELKQKLKKD